VLQARRMQNKTDACYTVCLVYVGVVRGCAVKEASSFGYVRYARTYTWAALVKDSNSSLLSKYMSMV
jgi:hypothetical protein